MSRKARKLLETMRDFSANEIEETRGLLINHTIEALKTEIRGEFEKSLEELEQRLNKRVISANRRVNMAENRIKKLRKIRGRRR